MVKVEVEVSKEDVTTLFFEARDASDHTRAGLDAIYAALVGGKIISSGYNDSTRFVLKIKMPEFSDA